MARISIVIRIDIAILINHQAKTNIVTKRRLAAVVIKKRTRTRTRKKKSIHHLAAIRITRAHDMIKIDIDQATKIRIETRIVIVKRAHHRNIIHRVVHQSIATKIGTHRPNPVIEIESVQRKVIIPIKMVMEELVK